jgi:hypothetical protein
LRPAPRWNDRGDQWITRALEAIRHR